MLDAQQLTKHHSFKQQWIRLVAVVVLTLGCWACPANGQELADEMRNIFNEMLPQLDQDLQGKVRNALEENQDYLELTPDQFKRFRDHPANPFEGWDGIDPDAIEGLIRLQFETQPIRSRDPGENERQSKELLESYRNVVAAAAASTVAVTDGNVQIALGTVVTDEGHVLTKLSEIGECENLFCNTNDGRRWQTEIVAKNQANDVAILKLPTAELKPIVLADEQPEIGGFVFTTEAKKTPLAFGVYSNPPRSLIGKNQAFLGVKPEDNAEGVRIVEVTPGSSADDVGLQINDIIKTIDGREIESVQALVNQIRQNRPGDQITVEFIRGGQSQAVRAILAGRNVGGPTADRFKQMNSFGAIQSERRDEFPLVFQHDTPLVPEQCGGPVTNSRGEVIGINIARGGRVASYAIPSNHVKILVREMLRPNVASNDMD